MAEVSEAEKLRMRKKLRSIGCAFDVESPKEPADLEKTILSCLRYYWTYNTFFFMCYSLLKHRLHKLVNVERLAALAVDLPNDELVLLLALSRRMIKLGDVRFKKVIEEWETPGLVMNNPPPGEQDQHLINEWGQEETLEYYGVAVRSFYEELPKKFYTLSGICKENEWLRVRAKWGAGFKADVAYMKISGKVTSPEEVREKVVCSPQEAKRLWRDLAKVVKIDDVA